jgi:hypothetical protein
MVPPTPLSTRGHRSRRATAAHTVRVATGAAFSLLAALIAVAAAVSSFEVATAPAAGAASWAPVHAGDFPDPSILDWNGSYYAFATQSFAAPGQTINIQVSSSPDGVHWAQSNADALPQLPGWAHEGNTWSPSVVYNSATNEFVMYYTATEASTGDQCIGFATAPATSPLGPYTDSSSAPVVCQNGVDLGATVDNGNYGGSIDPDVFTDPSGQSWLLWKSDGNHIGLGQTSIWSVPLTSFLVPVGGANPSPLLSDDQSWQRGIIEGPNMYFRPASGGGGTYFLFYSGGSFGTSTYAIGWATCSGPSGPCSDGTTSNPLLTSSGGMSGPGGPDVYTLPSGQPVTAFAAWYGTTIGYMSSGFRPMYLADLTFDTSISPPTPCLTLDPAGGSTPATSPTCSPAPPNSSYWLVASDGGIFTFGNAGFFGSAGSLPLVRPVVGMAPTASKDGYWLVASDGGIFTYGDAAFHGSMGGKPLNAPVVGMAAMPDGGGYWLVASDGGIFSFGDAAFHGSMGGTPLNKPIVGMAATNDGLGYWLVASDGGIFSFGDAAFHGSMGGIPLNRPIVGMAAGSNALGYWMVASDGGIFDFGDAGFYGSVGGTPLNRPAVGMAATPDGHGYWIAASDGGIFTYGDANFYGSTGGTVLNKPVVGTASAS